MSNVIVHQLIFNVIRSHFLLLDGLLPAISLASESKGPFDIHFLFIHPSGCINTTRSFCRAGGFVNFAPFPLESVPFPPLGRKDSEWQLILRWFISD